MEYSEKRFIEREIVYISSVTFIKKKRARSKMQHVCMVTSYFKKISIRPLFVEHTHSFFLLQAGISLAPGWPLQNLSSQESHWDLDNMDWPFIKNAAEPVYTKWTKGMAQETFPRKKKLWALWNHRFAKQLCNDIQTSVSSV